MNFSLILRSGQDFLTVNSKPRNNKLLSVTSPRTGSKFLGKKNISEVKRQLTNIKLNIASSQYIPQIKG